MKIAIVDYGMGNIKSITSTLIFLGVDEVLVTNNFDELKNLKDLRLIVEPTLRLSMEYSYHSMV